jgi:hypothetical protein
VLFQKKLEIKHGLALFAWLISRTFSVNEQYFSLTTNQRTVLSAMTFQPNEEDVGLWDRWTGVRSTDPKRIPPLFSFVFRIAVVELGCTLTVCLIYRMTI